MFKWHVPVRVRVYISLHAHTTDKVQSTFGSAVGTGIYFSSSCGLDTVTSRSSYCSTSIASVGALAAAPIAAVAVRARFVVVVAPCLAYWNRARKYDAIC